MDRQRQVFLIILGVLFHLSDCEKLAGYDFPVYPTKACPTNKGEWNKRSSAINCTEGNGYMCLPNEHFTELLEFCYVQPFIWIQEGICLFLYKSFSRVHGYNCNGFRYGCPNSSIASYKLIEYPSFSSLGNGCFLAEPGCETVDDSQETKKPKIKDNIGYIIFGVFAGLNTIVFILGYHQIRKRKTKAYHTTTFSFQGIEIKTGENRIINNDFSETVSIIAMSSGKNTTSENLQEAGSVFILEQNKCSISPLIIACESGHTQELSTNYKDIDFYNKKWFGPLFVACQNGHFDIAQRILSRKSYFHSFVQEEGSLLIVACQNGHTNIVKLLLKYGADVNICNENGASPLYMACFNGHTRTAQLLIQNGADINLCSKSGTSPLFAACQNEHKIVVQILLNNGAQIDLCDELGSSPLYVACQNGHDNIVKLLLDYGADINFGNKKGFSPLNVASYMGYETTTSLLQKNEANHE